MWNQQTLKQVLKNKAEGTIPEIKNVSFNSRTCSPSSLFIALPPHPTNHGGLYIPDAQSKGATILWDDTSPIQPDKSSPSLHVPCTYQALQDMALFRLQHRTFSFILVTGSHGKTSTKDIFKSISDPNTFASPKNENTFISLCLHVTNIPSSAKSVILEASISDLNEMDPVASLMQGQADAAIITCIAPAHLENLKTLQNVLQEKAKIWQTLKKSGFAIYEQDQPYSQELASYIPKHAQHLTFGQTSESTASLSSYEFCPTTHKSLWHCTIMNQTLSITSSLSGIHMARNTLAASLAVIHTTSLSLEILPQKVQQISCTLGRGNTQKTQYGLLINSSYNAASPCAVLANTNMLLQFQHQHSVIALSELAEQNPDEKISVHNKLLNTLLSSNISHILLLGAVWEHTAHKMNPRVVITQSKNDFSTIIMQHLKKHTAILVQGSRSFELQSLIDDIAHASPRKE